MASSIVFIAHNSRHRTTVASFSACGMPLRHSNTQNMLAEKLHLSADMILSYFLINIFLSLL